MKENSPTSILSQADRVVLPTPPKEQILREDLAKDKIEGGLIPNIPDFQTDLGIVKLMDYLGMDASDKHDQNKMKKLKVIWEWSSKYGDPLTVTRALDNNLGYKGSMSQLDKLYLYINLNKQEDEIREQLANIKRNKDTFYEDSSYNRI